MVARVRGRKARFCSGGCRSGFAEDRRSGLIYGPHKLFGVWCLDREEWSLAGLACAYCGTFTPGCVPPDLQQKFAVNRKGELR